MLNWKRCFPLRYALLVAALLPIAAPAFAQQPAGPRYALVIGNSNYANPFPNLRNPVRDARALSASLRALGFQVTDLYDQNQNQIRRAVINLRDELARNQASEGFFYFAGHGVQANGVNYLIPIGAQVSREQDLEVEAVSLQQEVLDQIQQAGNKVNIIVLDACRDNPLPSGVRGAERGLAVVKSIPPESTILFSTVDNSAALDGDGQNSPFALALLHHLADPTDIALTIKAIASEVSEVTGGKQTPTAYGIIRQSYSLNAQGSFAPAPEKPTVTVVQVHGSLAVNVKTAGTLYVNQVQVGQLAASSSARLDEVVTGQAVVEMRYPDGKRERQTVEVQQDSVMTVSFTYVTPPKSFPLSLEVRPAVDLPLNNTPAYFSSGAAMQASLDYLFPGGTFVFLLGVQYGYLPLPTQDSISLLTGMIGSEARIPLSQLLAVVIHVDDGYWYGTFNGITGTGSDFYVAAGLELRYAMSPSFTMGLVAQYLYYNNLYQGLGIGANTTFPLGKADNGQ